MARVLITGSTDGIGLATAHAVVAQGGEVVVHGRDPRRVADARRLLGSGAVAELVADFTDLDQVADAAAEAQSLGLTAVINNAAVYCRERAVTVDGHEQMWQVNHLGPALLTELLAPQLPAGSRVVSLTSVIHQRGRLDLADPSYETARWHHFRAHATTKLAALMMTREWARTYPHLWFAAVHPGTVSTKLLHDGMKIPAGETSPEDAGAEVAAALTSTAPSGSYLVHGEASTPCPNARDDEAAAQLRATTRDSLGLAG